MPSFSLKEARQQAKEGGSLALSIAHYLGILQALPERRAGLEKEFTEALVAFASKRTSDGQGDSGLEYVSAGLGLYPRSAELRTALVRLLSRQRRYADALEVGLPLLLAAREAGRPLRELEEDVGRLRAHLVDAWHFPMLNDRPRNAAYAAALQAAVRDRRALGRSEVRVLDVGGGSGLLSLLALRAGASSVVAVERSRVQCSLASAVLDGYPEVRGRIEVKECESAELEVDEEEKFDLLVTETMDAGFFGEGMAESLGDAQLRLLKPDALTIPSSVRLYVALAQAPSIAEEHFAHIDGVEIQSRSCAHSQQRKEPYDTADLRAMGEGFQLLSEPVQVLELSMARAAEVAGEGLSGELELSASQDGRLHAVVGWFETELYPGAASLSTAPTSDCRAWEQILFPHRPTNVAAGEDTISLSWELKGRWFAVSVDDDTAESSAKTFTAELEDEVPLLNDAELLSILAEWAGASDGPTVDLFRLPLLSLALALRLCSTQSSSVHTAILPPELLPYGKMVAEAFPAAPLRFVSQAEAGGAEFGTALVLPAGRSGELREWLWQRPWEGLGFKELRPSSLRLMGVAVESSELERLCCLRDEEATLGVRLREPLNLLRLHRRPHLRLHVLPHKTLSQPLELLRWRFSEPAPDFDEQKHSLELTRDGRVSGLAVSAEVEAGDGRWGAFRSIGSVAHLAPPPTRDAAATASPMAFASRCHLDSFALTL